MTEANYMQLADVIEKERQDPHVWDLLEFEAIAERMNDYTDAQLADGHQRWIASLNVIRRRLLMVKE